MISVLIRRGSLNVDIDGRRCEDTRRKRIKKKKQEEEILPLQPSENQPAYP